MEAKLQKLLAELPENQYVTAEALAKKLGIGTKTVYVKIVDLANELKGNGAQIVSKRHYGYMLKIDDKQQFADFLCISSEHRRSRLPDTPEERATYILYMLINSRVYLRLDDIADSMYVSKASISNDIKRIEKELETYRLSLTRKPYYGVKVTGKERRIRQLIADHLQRGEFGDFYDEAGSVSLKDVRTEMEHICKKHSLSFHCDAFEKLCLQMLIGIKRITLGFEAENDEGFIVEKIDDDILLTANEVADALVRIGGISISKGDFEFIIRHLQGKRTIAEREKTQKKVVVTEHINNLSTKMLDSVYTQLGLDLRGDFDLRLSLSMHLIPFDIRMKYDMVLHHPEIKDIVEHYSFAFSVASIAYAAIQEYYDYPIPLGEIAYIVPFFVLAMDKSVKMRKKSVLLVCTTGQASSQLLAYKFRENFSDYLERIEVIDMLALSKEYAEAFDYIFTTVPISGDISKPVFELSQFLREDEVLRVRSILSRSEVKGLQLYYKRELFFTDVGGKDRNGAIANICKLISEIYLLPAGFEESIIEREDFFSTDYGNLVAFPHPMEPLSDETFVSVAMLEKPIFWERNEVQVVLTVSIAKSVGVNEQLKKFYEVTADLLTDEDGIKKLISSPTYETLLGLLY